MAGVVGPEAGDRMASIGFPEAPLGLRCDCEGDSTAANAIGINPPLSFFLAPDYPPRLS